MAATEQVFQAVKQVAAGGRIAANGLATAGRFTNRLTATNGLTDRLATTNGLADRRVAASVMLVEQTCQQAATRSGTGRLANRLASADGLANGLTATNRLANRFATTNGLTTAVTAAATEQRFQVTESAGILGLAGDQRQSQNRRNDYTTHREVSMEVGQKG